MKEMVGGCCVCSDERGWSENPLVYCDGQGCTVAVHQACYGIVTVPTGPWYCRKCESQERAARVRCDLCPSRDGALKRTDSAGWAHVVCALYIPEVRFGNVTTMEPIILQLIPPERFNKVCYICQEMNKGGRASIGACMQCNKSGCKQQFHVTCAQALGLLCEEAGNYLDNVKYCGYCQHHYSKLKKGGNVKTIPPYKPIPTEQNSSDSSPEKEPEPILSPMVGIPVVTQPPKQPTPVPKSDPQPTKSSGRKSSSGSKSVSSSASSSSSNSSSVSAGLKNLTVNLTKEKHISKNSKGTTQSKSYDKDKSSRSQKSLTPTSSSTSSNNKSQKESTQSSDADRKTPVLENTKITEKNVSKKDLKDHNNQKFSNSSFTDSVSVNSDSLVGDNKDYTSGSKSSAMKKRKVESRTSTPVPLQESNLHDANHQLTQNVIVNLSDAKEIVEEKHKKAKIEASATATQIQEGTQSTSAGAHSSNTQHAVASTSQSVLKTDSISPIPQVVAPAIIPNPNSTQTNSLVISVPLSNANPSLLNQGQVNPSLYQQLARNEHSSDRLNNSRQSPVVTSVIEQQSPLTDQGLNNSSTISALNAMHAQTSQMSRLNEQGASQSSVMHHQIGAVPINQSVSHPSSSGQNLNTLSSEMSGGGLKITYEKQTKAEEPTKRSRSHSSDKNVEKARTNKRRSATNNSQSQLINSNNTSTAVTQQQQQPNLNTSTSITTQVNTHSITNTNTSISTQSQSIAQSQQVQITTIHKRSSRSHPTPPPVANVSAMSVAKESPPSSPTPEEQPQKRKGRKPAVQSNTVSSPPDVKDVKLFQNGVHAPHMLGNQLNPNSNMAQKMSDHLNHELEAHSVFSGTIGGGSVGINADGDNSQGALLVGPPLLRNTGATRATAPSSGIGNLLGGGASAAGSTGGNGMGAAVPQSLDQLLERQWEQGSQFLMEQAQHFDIASLLSCLHQLRTENARLEEHVNTLVARRDHLLAVNARLAIPLTQPIPSGNAGGGVLRSGANPGENGGPQEYRQVRHSPANQYVSVGIIPPAHGQLRPQGPVEGARGNRASYQPYPVVTTQHQQQQLPMRRDPDRDTHHSQKPN